jgi:hypothetical protein
METKRCLNLDSNEEANGLIVESGWSDRHRLASLGIFGVSMDLQACLHLKIIRLQPSAFNNITQRR